MQITGASGRMAFYSGTNVLSNTANLLWDNGNNRQTILGTVAGTGTNNAFLNLNSGTITGATEFLRMSGNITGNMLAVMTNANNVAGSNTILQIAVGGTVAADPIIQFTVTGGVGTFSIGVDNSDADKFKISPNSASPGGNANSGIIVTNSALTPFVGINKDAPAFPLDVAGKQRTDQYHGASVEWIAADLNFGTGAGTGPVFTSMIGTHNFVRLKFKTGTAPALNAAIFTITRKTGFTFSTQAFPVFSAGNAQTAGEITKLYVGTDNGSQYTFNSNGTLTAVANYELLIFFSGY